jgi:hypothetical protein
MKVKLPADEQDRLMRPAYITFNQSGVAMCENRYVQMFILVSVFSVPGLRCHLHDQKYVVSGTPACGRPTLPWLLVQESNSLPTEKIRFLSLSSMFADVSASLPIQSIDTRFSSCPAIA